MAGGINLASAYVSLHVSTKGMAGEVNKAMAAAGRSGRKSFNAAFGASGKALPVPAPSTKGMTKKGEQAGEKFSGAFDREVRTKIAAALKSLPDAKVGADTSEVDRKVAQTRAALERLGKRRVGVDIDESKALARLELLQARLTELGDGDDATIGVKANTALAAGQLAQVRVQAERLGALTPTVKVDADTSVAQAKLAAVQARAGAVSASAGVGGLAAAGMALGPAVVPGAAAAVAGVAGLAGAGAAAGAGGAVAATALYGVGDAITALKDAQDKQGKTAEQVKAANEKAAAAMGKLSPEAQRFTKYLLALGKPLSDLQKSAARGFLPGLQRGMQAAGKALAPFRGQIGTFAREMGDLAEQAGKGLGGKAFQDFFRMVGKEGPSTLGATGRIIGNLAKAFTGLAVAFSPVSKQMLGGLEKLTGRFANFANEGEGGGLSKFVAYVQEMGPKVARMFGAIGRAIGAIAIAMAPWGAFVVGMITKLSNGIASLPVGVLRALMGTVIGLTLAYKAANTVAFIYQGYQRLAALWTNRSTLATVRQTIAEKAKMAAQKAGLVVTKAITIAQRAMNLAMRMNPIGLVITALIALGAGLVLAYKKSETFRRIVNAAWAGIKKAASATVGWLRNTAWPWMKAAFTNIGNAAKWLWQKGIKPAFNGIKAVISWWYKNVVKRYFALVRAVFRGAAATAKWLWGKIKAYFRGIQVTASWLWGKVKATFAFMRRGFQGVGSIAKWLWGQIKAHFRRIADNAKWLWGKVKWAFDKMKAGMRSVKNGVVTARDGIKSAWSKIYGYLKNPIVKALKWLNKNFVGKLNSMLGKIPGVDLKIPSISTKGFATGGYTGAGAKYAPAGVVHRDEFVLRKEATNKLRKTVGLSGLNHMNETGQMPGYAKGGYVYPSMVRWIKNKVPAGQITSTKRNWGTGSYHDVGKAIDVGGSSSVMKQVASAIQRSFGNKIAELIHNPGFSVKNGQRVSSGFWGGSTWGAHRDHVHWAMNSMSASALKGMSGFVNGAFTEDPGNWFEKKLKAITGKFSPKGMGLAGEVIPSVMKSVKDGIKKRVVDAMSISIGDDANGGISFKNVAAGPNMMMGKSLAAQAGWTGGQWTALRELWNRESNWNHKAKNPSSGAYGIPQSLPGSKMASAGGDWRTNAQTQIRWGLNYIRGRYGSPRAALAFHNRKNWYADGGHVTPPVFDNGGTLAPGLNLVNNKLGRPEALVRPEQMQSPLSGPVVVNVIDRDGSFVDRMRGEIDLAGSHSATRARMGAGGRF